jgi:hypothetical protein
MKRRILILLALVLGFTVFYLGCGTTANCPTCGTTQNDGYAIINIIPVPEHNPTGEPGGPFNSFDISVVDPINRRFYVSDRIGLDVVVVDTVNDVAVNTIGGFNSVAEEGINASSCPSTIPPIVTGLGNFTRFGCRTQNFTLPGGIGPNGFFGGFPGAQCCAARANGVNPLSAPDGEVLTPDGKTLFVGSGSSSVVVFDVTNPTDPTNPSPILAVIPTGISPDYDGPAGIGPCIASSAGRAFTDQSGTCGDLRADEMSYDPQHQILLVTNGDPGFPFATLIDMSAIVARTGTGKWTNSDPHCLPLSQSTPYGPPLGGGGSGAINAPSCIMGQIYYDGAPANNIGVAVDDQTPAGFPCPDPSDGTTLSGVTGTGLVNGASKPCHHGPILTLQGQYCSNQAVAPATCNGSTAPAGLGASAYNPNTGHFLVTNSNALVPVGTSPGLIAVGTVDEIDPRPGNPNGPVVVNSIPVMNCMPTSIVQGPGTDFLVGCADHDGVAFPPNEYIINGSATANGLTNGTILATITNVGGVDEIWYNPGDKRYYLAARDMPNGPVLGVIDAVGRQWLQNAVTNSNSHSVSADPNTNHVFVPMQAGSGCTTQSANGCIAVYASQ